MQDAPRDDIVFDVTTCDVLGDDLNSGHGIGETTASLLAPSIALRSNAMMLSHSCNISGHRNVTINPLNPPLRGAGAATSSARNTCPTSSVIPSSCGVVSEAARHVYENTSATSVALAVATVPAVSQSFRGERAPVELWSHGLQVLPFVNDGPARPRDGDAAAAPISPFTLLDHPTAAPAVATSAATCRRSCHPSLADSVSQQLSVIREAD
jgi:hypothetical protein